MLSAVLRQDSTPRETEREEHLARARALARVVRFAVVRPWIGSSAAAARAVARAIMLAARLIVASPLLLMRPALPVARCAEPVALEDSAVVIAALGLAAAAGALQFSLSSGDKGINAFLMKERGDNPFYKDDFRADKPKPGILKGLRLPSLPFVEVYGQDNAFQAMQPQREDVAALYRALDEAIERERYEEAAAIKDQIDQLLNDT